jgi:hypothetical protein
MLRAPRFLVRRCTVVLLALVVTAGGIGCASGRPDARKLAVGGLRVQQVTEQAVKTTDALYTQKVITGPQATKVLNVADRIVAAGKQYATALQTYLATSSRIDGMSASVAFTTLLSEFAQLVGAADYPGLRDQIERQAKDAQPAIDLTRSALPAQ